MRQLGDLAFLLRQYAFAESTYRLAAQVRAPGGARVKARDLVCGWPGTQGCFGSPSGGVGGAPRSGVPDGWVTAFE